MRPASALILVGFPILFWIAVTVLVIALKRFIVRRWKEARKSGG